MTRLLRRIRPDVLLTLYGDPGFICGIAAARAEGIPVVIHVMRTFETWFPRRSYRERVKRGLFPRVDVHAPGPDSAEYALSYGANPSRLHVIAEPVNVRRFAEGAAEARQSGSRLGEGIVFLYVGRLWRGKGLDFLLDAFGQLTAAGLDASLVLVGDGVDENHYRLRAGGMSRVTIHPFVEGHLLTQMYGGADVFVFPTLGDPYGLVVQEAMAARLPVITTSAAGDITDRVVHGKTGLIVEPASATALFQAMRTMAFDANLRARAGLAGYEQIRFRTLEWWAGEVDHLVSSIVERDG
jgi:glycosyltransferase involved in cell wall biosynthesis